MNTTLVLQGDFILYNHKKEPVHIVCVQITKPPFANRVIPQAAYTISQKTLAKEKEGILLN